MKFEFEGKEEVENRGLRADNKYLRDRVTNEVPYLETERIELKYKVAELEDSLSFWKTIAATLFVISLIFFFALVGC